MAKDKIVIIGAGINGLVAAFYLKRAGFDVTLLERKPRVGGACSHATLKHRGRAYTYPNGASVLGFMQDFVFEETGLADRLSVHVPRHPQVVYAAGHGTPAVMYGDARKLAKELQDKWGETGDVAAFERDAEKIAGFLRKGYRDAIPPTLAQARQKLGAPLVKRWITGSAKDLVAHYFTSDAARLFQAIAATESGPVPLDSPSSAFSIPLMTSGSIFGGRWGYVKGGLWTLVAELGRIIREKGVNVICDAAVKTVAPDKTVTYKKSGRTYRVPADRVIFATDPLTAATIMRDKPLVKKISGQRLLGSSGKVVLFFKKPVRWKDDTGAPDFQMAIRFIMQQQNLTAEENASQRVRRNKADYAPGSIQVYCEGAGNRALGGRRHYDMLSVFFKNMALDKKGARLPQVKKAVTAAVLEKIDNKQDLVTGILLAPKDLQELFYFPGGNIDHTCLAEGQNFFDRNYSSDPKKDFYRFGRAPGIYYCAAGAYPCGSIAGTTGYMCAQQIIRASKRKK